MLYDFSWTDFKQTSLYLDGPPMADLRNDSSLAKPTNGLFLVGGEVVTYRSLGKGLFRGVWNSKAAASLRGHPAQVMALLLPWSTLHSNDLSKQLLTAQTPWERPPTSCNFWPSLSLTSFMNLLNLLSFIFLSLEAPLSLQKRMFQLKENKGTWQLKTEFSAISQMALSIRLLRHFTLWLI